ncbi:hypothetical protein [Melghiribacillus thermohalophilus]|uniref:hypothetical protein n=1 Tax=Melghiribacillus thermohalophilus TaxID=1324956 RepID=UPI001046A959|nr:hypothetical protein [Melghiribacillus thermohalophilus]
MNRMLLFDLLLLVILLCMTALHYFHYLSDWMVVFFAVPVMGYFVIFREWIVNYYKNKWMDNGD